MEKIILIIPHENFYQASSTMPPFIQWTNSLNEIVGIWDGHWADLYAKDMASVDERTFLYEVWQPDSRADSILESEIAPRIIHRLYPARIQGPAIDHTLVSCPSLINDVTVQSDSYFVLFGLSNVFNQIIMGSISNNNTTVCMNLDHQLPYDRLFKFGNPLKKLRIPCEHRRITRQAAKFDIVTYSTEAHKRKLNRMHSSLLQLPTGIDFDTWQINPDRKYFSSRFGVNDSVFVMVLSARWERDKGILEILKCLNEIQLDMDYKLFITGTGTSKSKYESQIYSEAQELVKLAKVKITGYLTDGDLLALYQRCNLFISASFWEGGPVSTVKAMALEKAILTTDTGLAAEVLMKHKCGKIIPHNYQRRIWAKALKDSILHNDKIPILPRSISRDFYDNKLIALRLLTAMKEKKKW